MRNFTKLMLIGTMLFVCLGGASSVSAKETTVYSVDYSTWNDQDTPPFYADNMPEGASIKVKDGLLVIENTNSTGDNWKLQYAVGSGFTTSSTLDYKVKITYKATAAGGVTVAFGNWDYRDTKYGVNLSVVESFQTVTVDFKNFAHSATDNFVLMQSRSLVATISISKVEVVEVTADGASTSTVFGDLVDVSPTMYAHNHGGNTDIASPDGEGVYTITDKESDPAGLAWDTQFWIVAPYALPAGKTFHVKFDYRADAAGSAGTQTHAASPGSYIIWHCIGDVAFDTKWQTFDQDVVIESDMAGWQSIAFNLHLNSDTKYYFKNISLKEPDILGEQVDFDVTSAGWATYSHNKDIDLGSVKGYAVKAHSGYVQLIPVTEVPANNAVLIEGAGKHSFEVIASAAAIAENDLQISNGSVTGDGSTIYALGKKGDDVGFVKVKNGVTIPKGKAYLYIATPPTFARDFIGFDDETTGIESVKQQAKADNQYFNIAGQRVAQPTKGLYIVNGKKVIIK